MAQELCYPDILIPEDTGAASCSTASVEKFATDPFRSSSVDKDEQTFSAFRGQTRLEHIILCLFWEQRREVSESSEHVLFSIQTTRKINEKAGKERKSKYFIIAIKSCIWDRTEDSGDFVQLPSPAHKMAKCKRWKKKNKKTTLF